MPEAKGVFYRFDKAPVRIRPKKARENL